MPDIIEIKELSAPELDIYARLSEPELRHYYEPAAGIFIAESPKVIERALAAGYEPVSALIEKRQLNETDSGTTETGLLLQRLKDIPVFTAETGVLTKLTGFQLTRGMLCAMRRKALSPVEMLCRDAKRITILENVVNPTNVGAIFRSAAALGMDAVLLTRACSDPLYRRAARVSMGTVFQIPWTYLDQEVETRWPEPAISMLRELGFRTAAMALSEEALGIDDERLSHAGRLAIVLGTEGEGLMPGTIGACDYTVRIPMFHGVDSLNVAAASAVAFWELSGRRNAASFDACI
ncbi:MAG: RNA methyltransferase [Eubacteriales bacterium]|nr:RNA methyltransferase [Eubacteriales bacterium]